MVVVNYDILGRYLNAWRGLNFDEAHHLKNQKSQRNRNARRLVQAATYRLLEPMN